MLGMEIDLILFLPPAPTHKKCHPSAGYIKNLDADCGRLSQPVLNCRHFAEWIGIILKQIECHRWRYRGIATLRERLDHLCDDHFQRSNVQRSVAAVEPVIDMGAELISGIGIVLAAICPAMDVVPGCWWLAEIMSLHAAKSDGIGLPIEIVRAFGAIQMADKPLDVARRFPGLDGEAADFGVIGIPPPREFDVDFAGIVGIDEQSEHDISIQHVDSALDQESMFAITGELGGIDFSAVPGGSLLPDSQMQPSLAINPDTGIAIRKLVRSRAPEARFDEPIAASKMNDSGAWGDGLIMKSSIIILCQQIEVAATQNNNQPCKR